MWPFPPLNTFRIFSFAQCSRVTWWLLWAPFSPCVELRPAPFTLETLRDFLLKYFTADFIVLYFPDSFFYSDIGLLKLFLIFNLPFFIFHIFVFCSNFWEIFSALSANPSVDIFASAVIFYKIYHCLCVEEPNRTTGQVSYTSVWEGVGETLCPFFAPKTRS